MSNEIYSNFKLCFPRIARRAVSWKFIDDGRTIIVDLNDGKSVLYDDARRTIRTLPTDSMRMSEYEFKREFKYRIDDMMKRKGVSQIRLAERTGITQSRLSDYIRGIRTPSFYIIHKIAQGLGCSIDDLTYTNK